MKAIFASMLLATTLISQSAHSEASCYDYWYDQCIEGTCGGTDNYSACAASNWVQKNCEENAEWMCEQEQ